jgi:farnesyl diphosphate synthase
MAYDFAADLAACADETEAGLAALLESETRHGPGEPPELLIAAMRHGTLGGGKRLRPLLVRQAAAVFGIDPRRARSAGLAVELVHCYSLIHDDLPAMDDDDLRRGRPTVHKAFDEATAILAGDALLTLAFGWLARTGHGDPDVRTRLLGELAEAAGTAGMVGGQMRDIENENGRLDESAIAQMQAMKTGALIRASVRMGAIIGYSNAEQLAALTEYAEAAGRAFQLADDILDVTATPQALGKASGKDAAAGKQTLVSRIGVDAARRRLGDLIHEAIGALSRFGPEADGLRATARYFATREN